jgi:hypothetical protein
MRFIRVNRTHRDQTADESTEQTTTTEVDEQTTEVLADADDVLADIDDCLDCEDTTPAADEVKAAIEFHDAATSDMGEYEFAAFTEKWRQRYAHTEIATMFGKCAC